MRRAVAIIVHSDSPSDREIISYVQCVRVLGAHPLLLVCPQSLNVSLYQELAGKQGREVTPVRFQDRHFQSVSTYNRLMLSTEFYRAFGEYEYILIYQLDAWVFRNDLATWCNRGYVYVGAPFFTERGELMPFAGNGGFSLRRVDSFLRLLEGKETCHTWNYSFLGIQFPAKTRFRAYIKQLLHICSMAVCRLSPRWYCTHMPGNEDMLYSRAFSLIDQRNVAPPDVAVFFAFERFPEATYEMAGRQLPFGWHAFDKYANDLKVESLSQAVKGNWDVRSSSIR